jgi:hypothetical protein
MAYAKTALLWLYVQLKEGIYILHSLAGSQHMFPGARSSPTDHVKRPRAHPGAKDVQARIVIPVEY